MDATIKDWANEVLSYYENEGFNITETDISGVFNFTSKHNEDIPFQLQLNKYGITVSYQAYYERISLKDINSINAGLTITKIYSPHEDDEIKIETTIPLLMQADEALLALIGIYIEESKAVMDILEQQSN